MYGVFRAWNKGSQSHPSRSIPEAFLRGEFRPELVVKHGRELAPVPQILLSGWAAVLSLS